MTELDTHLSGTLRQVADCSVPAGEAKVVLLRRSYPSPPEDVWDACTDPERLARWFVPVTGDFRLGGRYQIEGNAGGEILRCEPPRLLKISWIFPPDPDSDNFSEVELRLSPDGQGGSILELEHTAVVDPKFWDQFGPGAVGVGWDLTLLGLGMYLDGHPVEDKAGWMASPEAADFMTRSAQGWGHAHHSSGAPLDVASASMEATIAAYTAPPPDEEAEGGAD